MSEQRTFSQWHRLASENILASVNCCATDVVDRVDTTRKYAQLALLAASNIRERMLAMGVLMTADAIRTLHVTGLDTEP